MQESFTELCDSVEAKARVKDPEDEMEHNEQEQEGEKEKQEQEDRPTEKRQDPIPPSLGEEVRKPKPLDCLGDKNVNSYRKNSLDTLQF